MIAGTANAKESFPDRWDDIDFVCYEVITPELKPSKQFALIKKLNIISAIHKKMKMLINLNFQNILLTGGKIMIMILMVLLLLMINLSKNK